MRKPRKKQVRKNSDALPPDSRLDYRKARPNRFAARNRVAGRSRLFKVPLLLSPQPEGGFTVTSPLLPELVTEGDSVAEALVNAQDALAAVVEAYEELGRPLPANAVLGDTKSPVWLETLVATP
jgi:antitoxin HicB